MTISFDHYTRNARLRPGLLVLLPLVFAVAAWSSSSLQMFVTGSLVSLLCVSGATILLAEMVRDHGLAIEPGLWSDWGGKPTTQLLRHSRQGGNAIILQRYHKKLKSLLGRSMPTVDEETASLPHADSVYDAAISKLLPLTRDKIQFELLYSENVSYGFRRNLFAMRRPGILTSLGGTVASCIAAVWLSLSDQSSTLAWVCTAASAMMLVWWLASINSGWVKRQGFAYAEQLLQTLDVLAS